MRPYGQAEAEDELTCALRDSDEQRVALLAPAVDRFDVERGPFTILSAALWYASVGLRVLPLQPGHKEPHKGSRGCSEASSDPAVVAAWWQRWPGSNVGIATGTSVDVIDFDGTPAHTAWSGDPAYDKHDPYGGLRVVGTVSTPRPGGLHVYVATRGRTKNRIGMLPHVDYRGVGGYVVAPPSHTEVGRYRWLRTLRTDHLG